MKISQITFDGPRSSRPHLGRRIATAAVAATSFAALAMTPIAITTPTASADSETPLAIGSYNIRAGVSANDFSTALQGILPDVDVVGLQETNSMAKQAVLDNLSSSGFSYYRVPRKVAAGAEQSPIIWRSSRFSLISTKVQSIAAKSWVGKEISPKYEYVGPVWAVVVHLRDNVTGGNVSVINTHLPPGACINGGPAPSRPREFKVFRRAVINLGYLADQERSFGSVYTLGDFNVGYAADLRVGRIHLPVKTFGRLGMSSMWATERPSGKRGSHVNSPSLIDQVFAPQNATSATAHYDMTISDHYPVVAHYMVG